ncbi:MAG TPA: DUF302 domain-containing protein [Bacteroidales bacterium]|nr:DUF302 domain-containing protein [Bacteroidales bacterium]
MSYGYSKTVNLTYEEALTRVEEELKERGFGILTEIDVKATLKKKLNEDMNNYKILGACNPPFAHKAIEMEREIGLLLPCNVLVYTNDDNETVVSAIDANAMLSVVGDDDKIQEVATEVSNRLREAVDAVEQKATVSA